jgi:hypothetical protein
VTITQTVKAPRLAAGYRPKGKHQATNDVVYDFQPTLDTCCNRKCYQYFTDPKADNVVTARKPLYDNNTDRGELATMLRENARKYLLLPDGKPCCMIMACSIFSCSKMFLYKDTRPVQTRSEASSQCPKTVSVCAWFNNLKEGLDFMPDEGGWCMVKQPRRNMVHDEYIEDCKLFDELYTCCSPDHFNKVWAKNFPEVRLRKHCRFSKCSFCVHWRGVATSRDVSAFVKADAKNRLKQHYGWAQARERGYYHFKRDRAVKSPEDYISIAIDATDKLNNGLPHFFEKTKSDDGMRLKLHVIIAMVHGSSPYIFLAHENIKKDPNLVCEVLTRVLLAEEKKRGKLPETCYLQFDNCIRENKNTYTEKYVEWLVERGIHKLAEVSFLPVGHTHFDPDQLASRIGEIIKHRNIKSIEELIEVLEKCYTPKPTVTMIDDVLDWRSLVNPDNAADFPVGTSMCRRLRGCTTKTVAPEHMYYMPETSPLHWRIRRDEAGHVFMQTKHNVDDDLWSEPVYHWDTLATRPGGRECHLHESGLKPSDLTLAPRNKLSAERLEELDSTLEGARRRVSPEEWDQLQSALNELKDPTPVDQLPVPEHQWTFRCETDQRNNVVAMPSPPDLRMAPYSIYHDANDQELARDQRRTQGHCENVILMGSFLAYLPDYTADAPANIRNEFWLGKVVELDLDLKMVHVRRYNTSVPANATQGQNATYRPWPKSPKREWIAASRALCQFLKLTDKNRVPSKMRRRIDNALKVAAMERTSSSQEEDVGTGMEDEDE